MLLFSVYMEILSLQVLKENYDSQLVKCRLAVTLWKNETIFIY